MEGMLTAFIWTSRKHLIQFHMSAFWENLKDMELQSPELD